MTGFLDDLLEDEDDARAALRRTLAVVEVSLEKRAQLEHALRSRIVIEQAKGVVSRDHGLTVDEAFAVLRTHARNNHLRLVDLAHDVVTGKVTIPRP